MCGQPFTQARLVIVHVCILDATRTDFRGKEGTRRKDATQISVVANQSSHSPSKTPIDLHFCTRTHAEVNLHRFKINLMVIKAKGRRISRQPGTPCLPRPHFDQLTLPSVALTQSLVVFCRSRPHPPPDQATSSTPRPQSATLTGRRNPQFVPHGIASHPRCPPLQ